MREVSCIGHIVRRNGLLKRVTEGKIERRLEVTGSWGRRRKHLLDDLKETRRYTLKEEALDCTVWRTHFGGGRRPAV